MNNITTIKSKIRLNKCLFNLFHTTPVCYNNNYASIDSDCDFLGQLCTQLRFFWKHILYMRYSIKGDIFHGSFDCVIVKMAKDMTTTLKPR